jgi:hypothetical protein
MRFPRQFLTLIGVAAMFSSAHSQTAKPMRSTAPPVNPPEVMRFCASECFTFKWNGESYDAYQEGREDQGVHSKVTIQEFTPASVVMTVTNLHGPGIAALTGRISPEGNSTIDGVYTWTAGYSGGGHYEMTWESGAPSAIESKRQPTLQSSKRVSDPPTGESENLMVGTGTPRKLIMTVILEAPYEANISNPDNIAGVWEYSSGVNAWSRPGERIRIYQMKDFAIAIKMSGPSVLAPGVIFMLLKFDSKHSLPSLIYASGAPENKIIQTRGDVHVMDADHIDIAGLMTFRRISSASALDDIPCDPANRRHVTGEEARARANIAASLDQTNNSVCWEYIGAMEGNADAQAGYAYNLYNGIAIPKDLDQAVFWSKQSAVQGSFYGENQLADIFQHGIRCTGRS